MTNLQLAKDPYTTPEQLKVLATDDDWRVRCWVALNLNTLKETLQVLANDKFVNARWCVTRNSNTPLEILQLLATDDNWEVRYEAAHNPNATEIVRRLFLMTQAQTSSKTGT